MNIEYPLAEMEKSRKRLEAAYRFQWSDRAPVLLGIEARYLLHERGITFAEYFSDVKTQLIHQLENLKWRIEHIPDDAFASPLLVISPDFQNVTNSSGCGCDIFWQENETPQTVQCIGTLKELTAHELPDWRQTLWGKKLGWYGEMKRLVEEIDVRLNGERIPVQVTLGINADSPFMAAVDLAGPGFYEWLLDAPAECKAFLRKITNRYIEVETEFRKISDRLLNDGLSYSDDSAQIVSLEQYREFCVPVGQRLYKMFGNNLHNGRSMHLCGRNVHLHKALLDDLKITTLTGYGSENQPEEMGSLKGKVVLHGNVDPLLLYDGTPEKIERSTMHILKNLASSGGIVLGDGFNVVPATPWENLAAIRRASEAFGVPTKFDHAAP